MSEDDRAAKAARAKALVSQSNILRVPALTGFAVGEETAAEEGGRRW